MDIRLSRQTKLCVATAALLSLEPEIIDAGMTRLSEQERMVVDTGRGLGSLLSAAVL